MGPQVQLQIPEILPPAWRGGSAHVRLDREWLYPLMRRCANVVLLKIILHIVDQTTSWPDGPEFADITMDDWLAWTGASERSVEMQLAEGERRGWIAREKPDQRHSRGGYKFLPENVKDTPLPAQRTRKCKPREVSVKAHMPLAAMRVTPGAQTIAPAPPGSPGEPAVLPIVRSGAQTIALAETPCGAQLIAEDEQTVTLRVPKDALQPETGCAPGGCLLYKAVSILSKQAEPACSFPDDEGQKLQFWLSRQPWGFVSSLERRGLAPDELAPVLEELRAYGYSPEQFVEAMRARNIGIARDRENIAGLLITLIRALPRKPIPPANAPSNRLLRASEIKIP